MYAKVQNGHESDNSGYSLLSTQDETTVKNKTQEQKKQSSCCSNNNTQKKQSQKPIQQKKSKAAVKSDGCCSTKDKMTCCNIDVTPIFNAYVEIAMLVMSCTKYFFYILVMTTQPSVFYRFFIRKGQTPFNDITVLFKMLTTAFFCVMAYWSHAQAGPSTDPGYLEKRHFRKPEHQSNGHQHTVEEKDKNKPQKYPFDCNKCGTLKVLGVHHCGKCKRCVYKMDHHCPWTNNCVAYMTLKPFILFLFYVTCTAFFTVGLMYRQAWVLRMQHISLVQTFVPAASNVKHMLTMYYLNETEREEVLRYNNLEFERQVAFEKVHPELFSWAVLKDLMFNWTWTRFYFMYSWETVWDFVTIIVPLICGLYTMMLMVQTLSLARKQSSMIDDMKIKMYMKNRKLHRKELQEYWQVDKRRRTLSWTELWQLVFGEPTLFSIYTYVPYYRIPRSMDMASDEYLDNVEKEDENRKEN